MDKILCMSWRRELDTNRSLHRILVQITMTMSSNNFWKVKDLLGRISILIRSMGCKVMEQMRWPEIHTLRRSSCWCKCRIQQVARSQWLQSTIEITAERSSKIPQIKSLRRKISMFVTCLKIWTLKTKTRSWYWMKTSTLKSRRDKWVWLKEHVSSRLRWPINSSSKDRHRIKPKTITDKSLIRTWWWRQNLLRSNLNREKKTFQKLIWTSRPRRELCWWPISMTSQSTSCTRQMDTTKVRTLQRWVLESMRAKITCRRAPFCRRILPWKIRFSIRGGKLGWMHSKL